MKITNFRCMCCNKMDEQEEYWHYWNESKEENCAVCNDCKDLLKSKKCYIEDLKLLAECKKNQEKFLEKLEKQ